MCKHEKTALVKGWLPLEGNPQKYYFQRLFDCHLILIQPFSSESLNVTFLHKRFAALIATYSYSGNGVVQTCRYNETCNFLQQKTHLYMKLVV